MQSIDFRLKVEQTGPDRRRVTLPFHDGMGDPVTLGITTRSNGQWTSVDDQGAAAGLLFSMSQEEENSPAFRLMKAITQTHGVIIDFNEGALRLEHREGLTLTDAVSLMGKVILAILTAAPHAKSLIPK